MKLYLSGPMTGKSDYNFPLFNQVAEELRQRHHEVVNPAEFDLHIEPGSISWEEYLRRDIKIMLDLSAIALLPDWEHSRGARVELNLADILNYHVFEVDIETYELKSTQYGNQDYTVI